MSGTIGLFLLTSAVVVVVPGPDVLYVTGRSLEQGRLAGIISAMSAALAGIVFTFTMAGGLSLLIAGSVVAFSVIRYVGAAYLIYLGLHQLLRQPPADNRHEVRLTSLRRIFAQGFLVAILNPKTAIFFVAFVPQFVNPYLGTPWLQLTLLGLAFVGIGLLSDSCYALLSGTVGNWLRRQGRLVQLQRYVTGGIFLALGLIAVISHDPVRGYAAATRAQ